MKERPILFSGPMVRAILEGRKTMTRRVLDQRCEIHANGFITRPRGNERLCPVVCPYGQPGDRLWVRETWASLAAKPVAGAIVYRADTQGERVRVDAPWRPSIHMPRWASRILLEVVSVRVERLQEISGQDARAEGCPDKYVEGACQASVDALSREWFRNLWDSINASRDFGWTVNPMVWVVEFRRVEA